MYVNQAYVLGIKIRKYCCKNFAKFIIDDELSKLYLSVEINMNYLDQW